MKKLDRAAVAGALAFLMAGCGSGPPDGQQSDEATMLGGPVVLALSVPMAMDALDTDSDAGVELKYEPAGTNPVNIAAVMAGDAAFAFAARNAVFEAVAQGNDRLVIVANIVGRASACILRDDVIEAIDLSDDATAADKLRAMEGLTIASTPEGSGVNLEITRMLGEVGVDATRDLTIVPVADPAAMVAGVRQGKFDGVCQGVGLMEPMIVQGEADYWLSVPRGDLDEYTEPGVGGVVVTNRQVVEESPELVEKVFDAIVAAEQQIANDPDGVGAVMYSAWFDKMPKPAFDLAWAESLPTFPRDGKFTKQHFEAGLKDVTADSSNLNYEELVYERARD